MTTAKNTLDQFFTELQSNIEADIWFDNNDFSLLTKSDVAHIRAIVHELTGLYQRP